MEYNNNWLISNKSGKEFIFFWKPTPSPDGSITNSCLGQWWPSDFKKDGNTYPTAEHWMMAEKARLFGDTKTEKEILHATNPKTVKALGRKVTPFDAEKWDAAKMQIVINGNLLKFSQDPALKAYLLSTGDKVLVEASPLDKIWGIGMGENHEHATQPEHWKGSNLLGYALMAVRDQLNTQ